MWTSVFWLIHMQLQYMQAQTIPKNKVRVMKAASYPVILWLFLDADSSCWLSALPALRTVREANKEQEVRIITCLVFKISHLQNEPCKFKSSRRRSDQEEIYVGRMDTLVQHNNIGRQFDF